MKSVNEMYFKEEIQVEIDRIKTGGIKPTQNELLEQLIQFTNNEI